MAILKHISSKNANYGDAEKYLTFEHDEFTMKPTLDADGRLIPRVDYRISSLNCGGEDFAVYLQNTPGAFVSIGSASEYGLHHPGFNPDERLIEPAAHYFAQLAKTAFAHL